MKVLVLSTSGAKQDGITSWTLQTFGPMDRSGIDAVHTIAYPESPASVVKAHQALAIEVHTLPSRRHRPIAYALALRRLLKAEHYDLLHVNGNSGTVALELVASLGTGTKARIVHSRNTQGKHAALDAMLRPIMLQLTTDRVACGRDAGKWLFGDRSFAVIPNGRDFNTFNFDPDVRQMMRTELGLTDEHIAIGHVGNFNAEKNHSFLLDAFATAYNSNPRLRLFLAGDGGFRAAMEERARALHLADVVTFLGRTDRVPQLNCALDVAVLPSRWEGFPNVVVEWQISGLPSVVSSTVTDECDISGLVEFLPIDDEQAWARRLADATLTERVDAAERAQDALRDAGYEGGEAAVRLGSLYAGIRERISLSGSSIGLGS